MYDVIHAISCPHEVSDAASRLRETAQQTECSRRAILEVFEKWAAALDSQELRDISGLAFLRLWLRRGNLEPVLIRELGASSLDETWCSDSDNDRRQTRPFPLGVVGHWPATNIEIQPILSMTCALLGGNSCLVRVPSGLRRETELIVQKLVEVDAEKIVVNRIFMTSFDHSRRDLHESMAQAVDGAMIWGGAEAISELRRLPFPHWARVLIFGPRLSAAAMDAGTWNDSAQRSSWCRRIAREVWQFEQQACSSPQALFLEQRDDCDVTPFMDDLRSAFEEENRVHPRKQIDPGQTSAICLARASWLLSDPRNRAIFPAAPDWTILQGYGRDMPKPTQGRTLNVLLVDDLLEVISRLDGTVQTLGLAIADPAREVLLAKAAGRHGVDRVVRLGQMHVFGSPWDGTDLIRPMVRVVRHVNSQA